MEQNVQKGSFWTAAKHCWRKAGEEKKAIQYLGRREECLSGQKYLHITGIQSESTTGAGELALMSVITSHQAEARPEWLRCFAH